MSISSLLNTSKDSLISYQLALDLTGANIANVNTPGYSRQRATFTAVGKADVGGVRVQIGVNVTSIERIYDQYLDNQVVKQYQLNGYSEAKSDVLNRIEGIFEEGEGGSSDLLNKFWSAWSELSANPQGQVEIDNLSAAAENVASTFRRLDSELTSLVEDTGDNISNMVSQINDYLSEIADLNAKITSIANDKGETNILRDKRSELLNKVGSIINMDYVEDAKGAVSIFLANGRPLVTGNNTWQLAVTRNSANAVDDITYLDDPTVSLKQAISEGKRGKLAALLEISDVIVPGYQEKLDSFASTFTSAVNAQHRQGYDNYSNAGGDFFEPATHARDLRVSAAIEADANKIAASSTINGDGENARIIAEIKDESTMSGGTATLNEYYATLIGMVGRNVADAINSLDHQTSVMEQLTNRREATSGVSLDEEMMNLIKYQMAYNTTAKLVSTVNQIMDTLMQLVK